MEKQYYVYEIFNDVTQRKYIGLTSNYQQRFYQHQQKLKNGTHTAEGIMKDYVLYGINHFHFRLIDISSNEKDGRKKEKHYMNLYQTWNPEKGYNGNDPQFRVNPRPQYNLKLPDNLITRLLRRNSMGIHGLAWRMRIDCNLLTEKLINPMLFTGQELREVMEKLDFYAPFRSYLHSEKRRERYLKRLREKIDAEVMQCM